MTIAEVVYGPEHSTVAIGANNLGVVLQDLGDLPAAKAAFERALRICRQFLGEDHPATIRARNNLEQLERLLRG